MGYTPFDVVKIQPQQTQFSSNINSISLPNINNIVKMPSVFDQVGNTKQNQSTTNLADGLNTNVQNSRNKLGLNFSTNTANAYNVNIPKEFFISYKDGTHQGLDPSKIDELKNRYGFSDDQIAQIKAPGNNQIVSQKSWFQENKEGLKATFGAAQLGLGIASFLENRATAKDQRKQLRAQTDVLKEQLSEAKSEYSRVNNLRKKITASY